MKNFRDPLGLVMRMLRSRDPAARAALVRELLRILFTPLDWSLQWREQKRLRQPLSLEYPLILVVGAPRSGSTLAYQAICEHLDVTYFDNLSGLFPRSTLTAWEMFSRRISRQPADFGNYYGNTRHLRDANDGFHVWDRWLGGDRYRITKTLDSATQEQMRRFFAAWVHASQKPFANKNNRNLVCMAELARALPTAHFVVVRRDPRFVAQSLIRARELVQGDARIGWGLLSADADTDTDAPMAHVDAVCSQVLRIEDELCRQTAQIPDERRIHWDYETFCANPSEALEQLADAIPNVRLRAPNTRLKLPPFPANKKWALGRKAMDYVESLLSRPESVSQKNPLRAPTACE